MNSDLLSKLQTKYPDSDITKSALTGDWAGASEWSAKYGMWGLWAECRVAAGLTPTKRVTQ